MIRDECEECGAILEGPDSSVGNEDACPACGHTGRAPQRNANRTDGATRSFGRRAMIVAICVLGLIALWAVMNAVAPLLAPFDGTNQAQSRWRTRITSISLQSYRPALKFEVHVDTWEPTLEFALQKFVLVFAVNSTVPMKTVGREVLDLYLHNKSPSWSAVTCIPARGMPLFCIGEMGVKGLVHKFDPVIADASIHGIEMLKDTVDARLVLQLYDITWSLKSEGEVTVRAQVWTRDEGEWGPVSDVFEKTVISASGPVQ